MNTALEMLNNIKDNALLYYHVNKGWMYLVAEQWLNEMIAEAEKDGE